MLLLSFTAVKTVEVVFHEVSRETDLACHATAKLQYVHDSDFLPLLLHDRLSQSLWRLHERQLLLCQQQ